MVRRRRSGTRESLACSKPRHTPQLRFHTKNLTHTTGREETKGKAESCFFLLPLSLASFSWLFLLLLSLASFSDLLLLPCPHTRYQRRREEADGGRGRGRGRGGRRTGYQKSCHQVRNDLDRRHARLPYAHLPARSLPLSSDTPQDKTTTVRGTPQDT